MKGLGQLYASDVEAASDLAEELDIDVDDLIQETSVKPSDAVDLMRFFLGIYRNFPDMYPGDLTDDNARAVKRPRLALTPVLEVVRSLARATPYRDAVEQAFKSAPASKATSGDVVDLDNIICDVIRRCGKVPGASLKPWADNVFKQVGHHLGLQPFFFTYGFITPAQSMSGDTVKFGVTRKLYRIVPTSKERQRKLAALTARANLWGRMTAVDTGQQCLAMLTKLRKDAQACPAPYFPEEEYHNLWVERCFMNRCQRAARKPGLNIRGMSLKDFAQLCPDQKTWVQKLRSSAAESVTSFFKRLHYKDKAEYASMWLCIILCA